MFVPVLILFLFFGTILYFAGVAKSWWAPIQGFGHVLLIALITLVMFYSIEIVINRAIIPIGDHYARPAHDWATSPDHRDPAWDDDEDDMPTATATATNTPEPTAMPTEPSQATVTAEATAETTVQESCLTDAQKAMVSQTDLPEYIKDKATTMKADDPLCASAQEAIAKLMGGGTPSETGVAHTYEWATGDILGDGSCYMMISQPDQSLSLPSNHGTVAQDSFIAGSPAVYDQRVTEIQTAAVNDPHNKAHSCPMVKS